MRVFLFYKLNVMTDCSALQIALVKPKVVGGQAGDAADLWFSVCSSVSTLMMQCCSNAAPAGATVLFEVLRSQSRKKLLNKWLYF